MSDQNGLPSHWKVVKLGEIADKITDGTHHTPTYTGNGIPFISVKDVYGQKVHFNNCKYISLEEHAELVQRCKPEEGDVLITKSGTIGRLAIVPNADFSLFVSVALIKIQNKKSIITSKWLLYFLEFHIAFLDIQAKVKGGVVKNYHLEDLRQIQISLPPLAEQQRIVAKLEALFSELDVGLASLKTAAQQLKTYRQAVLKWAFEGKLTNEHVNEGELPTGWRWVKLNDVAKVSGGLTKNSRREKLELKLPFLRVANVYFNALNLTEVHTIGLNVNEVERVKLEKDDLLFVEGNGSIEQIGRVALWNGAIENCVHQNHLIKARLSERVTPAYALHFFCSKIGRDKIKEQANSTSGLYTLSLGKISKLELPLCALEE